MCGSKPDKDELNERTQHERDKGTDQEAQMNERASMMTDEDVLDGQ